jgi:mRNA interferase MazF
MTSSSIPKRGEIWIVNLNPTQGDEMGKRRTALVVSCDGFGRLALHIAVPITEWRPGFAVAPWFEKLAPTQANGLSKESGADTLQLRSLSRDRFVRKLGSVPGAQLQSICLRIALCIGLDPGTGST